MSLSGCLRPEHGTGKAAEAETSTTSGDCLLICRSQTWDTGTHYWYVSKGAQLRPWESQPGLEYHGALTHSYDKILILREGFVTTIIETGWEKKKKKHHKERNLYEIERLEDLSFHVRTSGKCFWMWKVFIVLMSSWLWPKRKSSVFREHRDWKICNKHIPGDAS